MTGFLERIGHFAKSRWKMGMGLVAVATIGYLIDRRGHIVKKYVGFKSPEGLEKDVTALLNGGGEGGF